MPARFAWQAFFYGTRCVHCASGVTAETQAATKKPPSFTLDGFVRCARRRSCDDYFAFISATVVSSMRFEKPHSLSYHDETFTSRPDTLVSVASKFDEAG